MQLLVHKGSRHSSSQQSMLRDWPSKVRIPTRNFSFLQNVKVQPSIHWVLGLVPGVKSPNGAVEHHFPPSSAQVKKGCNYISALYAFTAWTGAALHLPFYYFRCLIFSFSCAQGKFNHSTYDIFTRVTYTKPYFVSLQYFDHYLPLTITL